MTPFFYQAKPNQIAPLIELPAQLQKKGDKISDKLGLKNEKFSKI